MGILLGQLRLDGVSSVQNKDYFIRLDQILAKQGGKAEFQAGVGSFKGDDDGNRRGLRAVSIAEDRRPGGKQGGGLGLSNDPALEFGQRESSQSEYGSQYSQDECYKCGIGATIACGSEWGCQGGGYSRED